MLHTTTSFYTILFVTFGLIGTIFTVVGLLWTPLMWIEIVDSCLKMKGMGASLTWTGRFVKGFIVFYFICFGIAVFSTIASVVRRARLRGRTRVRADSSAACYTLTTPCPPVSHPVFKQDDAVNKLGILTCSVIGATYWKGARGMVGVIESMSAGGSQSEAASSRQHSL